MPQVRCTSGSFSIWATFLDFTKVANRMVMFSSPAIITYLTHGFPSSVTVANPDNCGLPIIVPSNHS